MENTILHYIDIVVCIDWILLKKVELEYMDRVTLFRTVIVAERRFLCDATSHDNLNDTSNEFHGTGMTTLSH